MKLSSSGALHSEMSLCAILRVNIAEKDTSELIWATNKEHERMFLSISEARHICNSHFQTSSQRVFISHMRDKEELVYLNCKIL